MVGYHQAERDPADETPSSDSLVPTHPLLASQVVEPKQKSEDDGTHGCGPYRSAWQGGRMVKNAE